MKMDSLTSINYQHFLLEMFKRYVQNSQQKYKTPKESQQKSEIYLECLKLRTKILLKPQVQKNGKKECSKNERNSEKRFYLCRIHVLFTNISF